MLEELPGIPAFVYTAELRSFRGAAKQLQLTPAAISKAVAKLEERLGVQLLERTSRQVKLTPVGTAYLKHCRVALDALRAGHDTVLAASAAPRGIVSVTLPIIVGPRVARALPRLASRHPRLSLDIRVTDRQVKLLEEDVDVAVRIGELPDSSLVARRLATLRWVSVASPSYLAQHGTPRAPRDLEQHVCIKFTRPAGGIVEWQFADGRGQPGHTFECPTGHRADDGDFLVTTAIAGMGIVQAFDFLVDEHIQAGRLLEVLPQHAALGPPVHALCRPRRQRIPKVRALIDLLVDTLGSPA